jgi:hypothetical protein
MSESEDQKPPVVHHPLSYDVAEERSIYIPSSQEEHYNATGFWLGDGRLIVNIRDYNTDDNFNTVFEGIPDSDLTLIMYTNGEGQYVAALVEGDVEWDGDPSSLGLPGGKGGNA